MSERPKPVLVAHRGDCRHLPENTLIALDSALRAGAAWVEFDVQLSADGVPLLLHDATLLRTAAVDRVVSEMDMDGVRGVFVGETRRLGRTHARTPLPTLADAVGLLRAWPDAQAFVEVKRAAIRRFGVADVVDRVVETLAPIRRRCVVISYDPDAVERAREGGAARTGWVLPAYDDTVRAQAAGLGCEFLLADHELLPDDATLWPGRWSWVLFEAGTADAAMRLSERGAAYVETMAISELMRDPRFSNGVQGRA